MPAPRKEISRPVSALREASSSRCATSSGSESGGSSASSRPSRNPSGICSKRSSIESTPIVASICSRSCSVNDRKLTRSAVLLLFEDLPVGRCVEQRVGLAGVREPNPYQPPFAVWVLVHGLGSIDDLAVDLDYLARKRRDQIRHGLDGLDLAVRLVLGDRRSLVRRLEMDELSQRVLGEPGDTERGV